MQTATKVIWIIAVAVAVVAGLWFLYLVQYNRTKIGPAGPYTLYFICIPTLIFAIASIVLLIKGIVPTNTIAQIILVLFLIIFSLVFSGTLLRQPSFEKQMQETEERNRQFLDENRKTTVDGKYEYMLYLVGTLTDTPRSHISIRDIANEERKNISIDFKMEDIKPDAVELSSALLIELSPTDQENIYILTTTPYLKDEIETFEIDMEAGTSRKIE